MPIELLPPPPARIAPLRGDDVFTHAERQSRREARQRVEVPGFPGQGQGFNQTIEKPRRARSERQFNRAGQGIRGGRESQRNDLNRPMDFELPLLVSQQSELTTESVIEAVDSLGEITQNLGGENYSSFSPQNRQEAAGILEEQILAFGESLQGLTEGAKANDRLLNGMSQLDFNSKCLEALQPLTEGLSKQQLRDLRKDIQGLSQLILSDGKVQLDKFEQGFNDWSEKNGRNLAQTLLITAGIIGTMARAVELMKRPKVRQGILLAILAITACTGIKPTGTSTTKPSETATVQASATPDIGLVGVASPTAVNADGATATPEVGQPSPWQPPSAEQARAGVGGNVPEGVSDQMAIYEDQAKLRMPQDVALQSSWNGASIENTGRDDLTRIATYGKNKAGNIIWSRLDGGSSFNEYPIRWYYDANGALQVLLEQEFGAIPDSKDAAVIFSGDASGPGDSFTFGEKPAIIKDIVTLPDGTQRYLEYFDFQEAVWKLNPDVLQAMAPDGYTVSQDQSGNWIASADNQTMLNFDFAKNMWLEALPSLPEQFLNQLPAEYEIVNGQVLVDGEAWFEINDSGEWEKIQRTITFDLEGGTMEMFRFDTLEETLEYIVITDGATWLETFDPWWDQKIPEDTAFWERIKTIPGLKFTMGAGLLESSTWKNFLFIDIFEVGDDTIILYRGDEGMLEVIMLNENAAIVSERIKNEEYRTILPPRPQP